MKKLSLFFFAMLASVIMSAQVSISHMATNYNAKQISFTVSWTVQPYNNQIWVITDYIKVVGASTVGNWSRATVTAVTKNTGVGTASTVTGNNRGFCLNTSGSSGSADVTATLSLANGVDKFNWCAYALNYPPKATIRAGGGYDLHGTPPFRINGNITESSKILSAGTCIVTLTDATDNPTFIIPAAPSITATSPTICYNTAANLTVTVSGGTTTAMTYTWNIGGNISSTTVTTKTSQILTANTTYTVQALTANGCTSDVSSGTMYILNPEISGQSPNECGCANGLTNCGTICLTECCDDCADWTTCGFNQIAPKAAGPIFTYSQAVAYCQSKYPINTWRLPTVTEGQCICNNRSSLPITYYQDNNFWTPTVYDAQHHVIIKIWETGCEVSYGRDDAARPVICVK
jgi:hypothetical protein